MNLIRTSFFAALVIFLMPTPPEQEGETGRLAQRGVPGQVDLIGAASSTVADVGAFCDRQPGVCETAHYLMWKFEAKAKYGVRLIYEWANEHPAGSDQPQSVAEQTVIVDPLTTGSSRRMAGNETLSPSQNSLRLEDMIPPWRGPRQPT